MTISKEKPNKGSKSYSGEDVPSHKEECAGLQVVDSRCGRTLSPCQQQLYALQPHCHEEVVHMQGPDPIFIWN